jgi:hypothetical protein
MGKVSINFYLNDKLKTKEENGETVYPLYVRIIHKRVLSRVKSLFLRFPVSKSMFEFEQNSPFLFQKETEFIKSFFEFAEKTIPDFIVNNSKTNLGKLLDFWHNSLFIVLYDYGFLDTETRGQIHKQTARYFAEKTGLHFGTTLLLIKDFRENSITHFLPLALDLKALHKAKVLTDKQAAKIEFIYLIWGATQTEKKRPKGVYQWYTDKENILQRVTKKAKFCTTEFITEFATETDMLIKDTVRHFYSQFYFTTDTARAEKEKELKKWEEFYTKFLNSKQ